MLTSVAYTPGRVPATQQQFVSACLPQTIFTLYAKTFSAPAVAPSSSRSGCVSGSASSLERLCFLAIATSVKSCGVMSSTIVRSKVAIVKAHRWRHKARPNHGQSLKPVLDERGRRRFAAAEARAAGFGGIQAVAQITGIARSTVGLQAVAEHTQQAADRVETDAVAEFLQAAGQVAQALGRPQQRPFRIATRRRLDQSTQVIEQAWIRFGERLAPGSWPAHAARARPARGRTIPTATPSSATSTIR